MRVAENVRSTHTEDGGIVLDILHGQMFRLNFVGSTILELLKQGCPEPEIAERLSREFRIDRATAETDVCEFLKLLEERNLIARRDSAEP